MGGVYNDSDPSPSQPTSGYASNWAGGYPGMTGAYEAWMFDDGPGSSNADCTRSNSSGCWGHRHDTLDPFGGTPTMMGAAAGVDQRGTRAYAMLIAGQDTRNPPPTFSYTWNQATADGAGTNAYHPGLPQIPVSVHVAVHGRGVVRDQTGGSCVSSCDLEETQGLPATLTPGSSAGSRFTGWSGACSGTGACTVTPAGPTASVTASFYTPPGAARLAVTRVLVHGHRVTATITKSAGRSLQCSLTTIRARPRYTRCWPTTVYSRVARGFYVLRVRDGRTVVARSLRVR